MSALTAWKSLAKKVLKFNEKFPQCGVICFGLISNHLVFEGSDEIKSKFAETEIVQNQYKQAILSADSNTNSINAPASNCEMGMLKDMLGIHVFDMNIHIMRAVLANAVAPPESIGAKDRRRNFYCESNAPQWWKDTGIPFESVNHSSGSDKKLRKESLMKLVEALQAHHSITPNFPHKKNKTNFKSRFVFDGNVENMEVENEEEFVETVVIEEPLSLNRKVSSILMEGISWEEKSLKIMRNIQNWDSLLSVCDLIKSSVPPIPATLATKWDTRKLVDIDNRYHKYIPSSIGDRIVLESTGNGNCMYNAISIVIYGHEKMSMLLKLASVFAMVGNLPDFAKYVNLEYSGQLLNHWLEHLDIYSASSAVSKLHVTDIEKL